METRGDIFWRHAFGFRWFEHVRRIISDYCSRNLKLLKRCTLKKIREVAGEIVKCVLETVAVFSGEKIVR